MTCSCDCLGYEGDGEGFVTETTVTARKQRRCVGCGGLIKPGQTATRVAGYWNGWSHYDYHEVCLETLKLAAEKAGTGWWYGCEILDCITYLLDDCVWPRDRETICMVSDVFEYSEDFGEDPT